MSNPTYIVGSTKNKCDEEKAPLLEVLEQCSKDDDGKTSSYSAKHHRFGRICPHIADLALRDEVVFSIDSISFSPDLATSHEASEATPASREMVSSLISTECFVAYLKIFVLETKGSRSIQTRQIQLEVHLS
jgi:hypothetical protein